MRKARRNKRKRAPKKKKEGKKLMKFKTLNRKRRCVVYNKNDKRSVSALKVKVVKREGGVESMGAGSKGKSVYRRV